MNDMQRLHALEILGDWMSGEISLEECRHKLSEAGLLKTQEPLQMQLPLFAPEKFKG